MIPFGPELRQLARSSVKPLCGCALLICCGCATARTRESGTAEPRQAERAGAPTVRTAADQDIGLKRVSGEPQPPDRRETASPDADRRLRADTRRADLSAVVPSPAVVPPPAAEYPIDLSTAMRLAEQENPTIAAARAAVTEALAAQLGARAILLPSLNAGTNYHLHTGNLQRSSGRILNLTEQSLYVGGGARAVAAETVGIPAVNLLGTLTEAWFEPLAARQRVVGSRFGAQATFNDILLDVVLLHLELLANQSILDAQRLTESQVYQVAIVTNDFAIAGEGRTADANRAQAEWKLHRAAVERADEALAVTAARLANRLNLDPAVRLRPVGGPLVPLNLVALDTPTYDLVQSALRTRPDLAARTADVARAEVHHREEIARPWIPTFWLGFSGGAFGGGSNVVPPLLAHFGGRTDFDVRLFWTLMNLGAGNLSLINRRDAQVGEAEARRVATINQVRKDVASAQADALAARAEIEVARSELASAENGFREDLDRSYQNLGRPIEVLNSLNLVGDARVNLVKAILHYDQAQFRLFVALGSPPPMLDAPNPDVPLPPVTTPLRAPVSMGEHSIHLGLE
jgi:outer membrane protein TolC